MVPGVIENGGGGAAQRLVGSRERELSGGIAGQGGGAHLQQAGFTNLSAQFTQGGGQCQVTGTNPPAGSTAPGGQAVTIAVTGPNQASCLGG